MPAVSRLCLNIRGGDDRHDPNFTNTGARPRGARGHLILILALATAPTTTAFAASPLALDPSLYVQERARDLVSWRAWDQASFDEARRATSPSSC